MSEKAMLPHLGIDVSKKKLNCALLLGEKWRDKVFDNSAAGLEALKTWLARQGGEGAHVCLEATNTYWELCAETLVDAGYPVSVVNPALPNHSSNSLARNRCMKLLRRSGNVSGVRSPVIVIF